MSLMVLDDNIVYRHFQVQVVLVISVLRHTLLPTSFKLVLQSIMTKLPMRENALLSQQTQASMYQSQVFVQLHGGKV